MKYKFESCRRQLRKELRKGRVVKEKKPAFTMATTTPLVTQIFDSIFKGQLDEKPSQIKRRRCGICEVGILLFYKRLENTEGNQKWTIQRNWQHRAHKKTQYAFDTTMRK